MSIVIRLEMKKMGMMMINQDQHPVFHTTCAWYTSTIHDAKLNGGLLNFRTEDSMARNEVNLALL